MRFLLFEGKGKLAASVGEAVVRHGHKVTLAAELDLKADMPVDDLLHAARKAQLDLITTDGHVVDEIFAKKLKFPRSVIFLQLSGGDVEQDDAIDRLFERYKSPSPERVYTVTETRVKVRQMPTGYGKAGEQ